MNTVTKVSDLTYLDLQDYLRIDEIIQSDINTLNNLMRIAKAFITKYTGVEDLDKDPDFVIVVLILVQDMWDNRTYYVDKSNLNNVVDSILSLHSVNLL